MNQKEKLLVFYVVMYYIYTSYNAIINLQHNKFNYPNAKVLKFNVLHTITQYFLN